MTNFWCIHTKATKRFELFNRSNLSDTRIECQLFGGANWMWWKNDWNTYKSDVYTQYTMCLCISTTSWLVYAYYYMHKWKNGKTVDLIYTRINNFNASQFARIRNILHWRKQFCNVNKRKCILWKFVVANENRLYLLGIW